jgi:protein-S-isoprenylcysteine O-methyltransferase Ste14
MIALGNQLFRYRNSVFPPLVLLLLLPGPRIFANPLHAALLAAVVATLGQTVRAVTIGLRYIKRGGRNGRVYAKDLVTEGIYGHIRNPMYVGNVLICLGVALASNELVVALAAVPLAAFAYAAIVAAEEHYLRERFGAAYDAYCRDVPRWLPDVRGLRTTLSQMGFNWRRVVVKEFGTPWGWISAICVLTVYNVWRAGTLDAHGGLVATIAAILVVATLLWATVLTLKKRRILVAE